MPQFKLTDGRELDIFDNGVTSPKAIVFHHGTPGHSSAWSSWLEAAALRGIRAFTYSRAGYGTSDRNFKRNVLANNGDISQILSAKDIESFVAIGWSGGGPHALASTFDHRCVGAITLAGVGQYGVGDLDFLEGMGPENHDEFNAALGGEDVLQSWMAANATGMKNVSGAEIREVFGGLIGEADKAVMSGEFANEMAASMRSALAVSFDGWVDDDFAFVKDWGFKLSEISKPVIIWQGDQDLMVPHAHSYWLKAKIAGAQLSFVPGHGHISLVVEYKEQILAQALELLK